MPFKSKAQRRKFYAMARRGEISQKVVKEWERATRGKRLPERLGSLLAKSRCAFKLPCRKGWRGGDARKVDPCQLKMGIKVEHEHFKDNRRACRTAVDHLTEKGGHSYYTRLKKARL